MQHSRFTEQLIAFVLEQVARGASVEGTCRKCGNPHSIRITLGAPSTQGLKPEEIRRLQADRGGEQAVQALLAALLVVKPPSGTALVPARCRPRRPAPATPPLASNRYWQSLSDYLPKADRRQCDPTRAQRRARWSSVRSRWTAMPGAAHTRHPPMMDSSLWAWLGRIWRVRRSCSSASRRVSSAGLRWAHAVRHQGGGRRRGHAGQQERARQQLRRADQHHEQGLEPAGAVGRWMMAPTPRSCSASMAPRAATSSFWSRGGRARHAGAAPADADRPLQRCRARPLAAAHGCEPAAPPLYRAGRRLQSRTRPRSSPSTWPRSSPSPADFGLEAVSLRDARFLQDYKGFVDSCSAGQAGRMGGGRGHRGERNGKRRRQASGRDALQRRAAGSRRAWVAGRTPATS